MTEEEEERPADDNGPFSALAFKIMADPFVGKLAFFRVYSGTLKSGSYVYNSTKGKKERVGRILQMHANNREEIGKVYSGDIAAAVGLKVSRQQVILCVTKNMRSFWNPWNSRIRLSRSPSSRRQRLDRKRWVSLLQSWQKKTRRSRRIPNEDTGQTIIAGMGELHLEIIVDRLLREFKVEANVGKPQVSYKETITAHGGYGSQVRKAVRWSWSVRSC